jgi:hypothetical protein
MATPTLEVRPRTVGEILDDGWELALADSPLLLALTGLFLAPAFAVLLLLLSLPRAGGAAQVVLPAAAALLLALTGLGSGACQELFRRRAEGGPVTLRACLVASTRRGLDHVAVRAAVLAAGLLGCGCLIVPGVAAWGVCATAHALIAGGRGGSWAGLEGVGREAGFETGKASLVVLVRLPLLALGVVNLAVAVAVGLWVADNFAGVETSFVAVQLSPLNPVYLVALLLLCWLLLAPYFEACNFLLYVDSRTRQEGLDLMFRVRRAFADRPPAPAEKAPRRPGVVALLALTAGLLLAPAPTRAEGQGNPPRLSREQVKRLLRHEGPAGEGGRRTPGERRTRREERKDEVQRDDDDLAKRRRSSSGAVGPQGGGGGFGRLGWLLLLGVALAVLLAAALRFWSSRRGPKPAPARREETRGQPPPPEEEPPHEQPAGVWWRRAEEHASAGRHLEGVRCLYRAVLSALHTRNLLRYEPTRTNGEYVRQVRLAPHAPPELHAPFERLTDSFEAHWYGSVPCAAEDYSACRRLAEQVRGQVGG